MANFVHALSILVYRKNDRQNAKMLVDNMVSLWRVHRPGQSLTFTVCTTYSTYIRCSRVEQKTGSQASDDLVLSNESHVSLFLRPPRKFRELNREYLWNRLRNTQSSFFCKYLYKVRARLKDTVQFLIFFQHARCSFEWPSESYP